MPTDRDRLDALTETTLDDLADGFHLSRRSPVARGLLRPAGERLHLLLGDRRVTVPARIEPAVRELLAHDELRPRDLHDHLDAAGAIVLTRRMVREGLLEVVR